MAKILINENGDKYLVKNTDTAYNFHDGFVQPEEFEKERITVFRNKEYFILDPSFNDYFERMKRGPQIETPKDLGGIIAEIPINSETIMIDAGSGSGAFSVFMSRFVKKIYSYENRQEHLVIARKNIENMKITNVETDLIDVSEQIPVKDVDIIHLDLREPWKVLTNANKSLKKSGYLVCYVSNILQVKEISDQAEQNGFLLFKVKEIIEREWKVKDKTVRPKNTEIGHTGFLCILRKFHNI